MRIQHIFLLQRKIAGKRNFLYPGHPFYICPKTSKITTGIRAHEFSSCTRKWVAPLITQPRRTSLHWSQTTFSTSRDDEDNDDEPDWSYFHGCFFDGHIPRKEIQTKMSRGGGPGGMNINANSTKAEIYFNLNKAHWIPEKVRERMHQKYGGFIDREGVLLITSMRSRSGTDNFDDCFEKLRDMLDETSLQLVKERRREYISPEHQQEVEKRKERAEGFRLASKKRISEKKKNRRQIN